MLLTPRGQGPARFVLGTMNFGRRTPEAVARSIVDRALDAGVTWLDTANLYGDGESERIVGRAVKGRRARFQLATKVGAARAGRGSEGLSRSRILAACDESLARLGVDDVDQYLLHVPDPHTPVAETLEAVAALLAAGKIRSWGVSNHAAWQVERMGALARAAGMPPPACAQQLFNVAVRQLELEWFRFAADTGLHTSVYNPLAGGLLAGHHTPDTVPRGSRFDGNALYRRRYWRPGMFVLVERLRELSSATGTRVVDLAYGALLQHPGVDSIVLGPGSLDHLDAALSARPLEPALADAVRAVVLDHVGTDASYAR